MGDKGQKDRDKVSKQKKAKLEKELKGKQGKE